MGDDNPEMKAKAKKISTWPGNSDCFDCGRQDDNVFAATEKGTFHCSECASLHRIAKTEVGLKCYEVSRDRFNEEDIEMLERVGNMEGAQLYLSNVPLFFPVPERREFRQSKKILQIWIECVHIHNFFASPQTQGKIADKEYKQKNRLADHLWLKIMSYLNGVDISALSLVAKRFVPLTQLMWRHAYLKDFNLKYPHLTSTFAWKEWKEMYFSASKACSTIESFNGKKRHGFDFSVPIYMNNNEALMEEFVQRRKYVNVSTHNLTIKLKLNIIEREKAKKGDVAVNGFIYLIDLRKQSKDQFVEEIAKYASLKLACATVMLGVVDDNSEKTIPADRAQKITQEHGFRFIPVGYKASRHEVYQGQEGGLQSSVSAPSPSSSSSMGGLQIANSHPISPVVTQQNSYANRVSPSQALKLAGEVLVEKLCQLGWPGVTIPPKWIPDNFANECMKCNKKFKVTNRRHHCRRCGVLCCGKCAKNKFEIPHIKQYTGQTHLICRDCEEELREIEKWEENKKKN